MHQVKKKLVIFRELDKSMKIKNLEEEKVSKMD